MNIRKAAGLIAAAALLAGGGIGLGATSAAANDAPSEWCSGTFAAPQGHCVYDVSPDYPNVEN
ncbi:hypothetical protein AB0J38_13550 [Streptomyces sp. NPDC050095]|uniref:hypothetical protein n=1 Tax=unclassified Streptomyces TaxID=2593676 RepID=UPI00342E682F